MNNKINANNSTEGRPAKIQKIERKNSGNSPQVANNSPLSQHESFTSPIGIFSEFSQNHLQWFQTQQTLARLMRDTNVGLFPLFQNSSYNGNSNMSLEGPAEKMGFEVRKKNFLIV